MILNYDQIDIVFYLKISCIKLCQDVLFYCSVLFKLLKYVIVLLLYQVYTNVRVNKVQTN